jgi:hypothetical protein
MSASVPLDAGVASVRIEIQNGTIGIDVHDERTVRYAGGVRRAADSAAGLAALEAIPALLSVARDPEDPGVLVLRGASTPEVPADAPAPEGFVFGYELGVRIPASVPVEVRIAGSGHVVVANRSAPTRIATGRGDLRIEHCRANVKASTGRGQVIVYDHRGDIDVDAKTGGMQVFLREPGTRVRLVTGMGDIQCYVPPETGFVVDARAEIGRIGSGFDLPVETIQKYGAAMVGRHGDGRTEVVLRTGSGHLSLGRRVFE